AADPVENLLDRKAEVDRVPAAGIGKPPIPAHLRIAAVGDGDFVRKRALYRLHRHKQHAKRALDRIESAGEVRQVYEAAEDAVDIRPQTVDVREHCGELLIGGDDRLVDGSGVAVERL